MYQLIVRHNRKKNDFLKSILKPMNLDSEDSDYEGKEEFKEEQDQDSNESISSCKYSDATTIKGTTVKAKLGDIRVTYTVKTC